MERNEKEKTNLKVNTYDREENEQKEKSEEDTEREEKMPKLEIAEEEEEEGRKKETETYSCRICRVSEEDPKKSFINPCDCKGSLAHVHRDCLQQWISYRVQSPSSPEERRRGGDIIPICELCRKPYKGKPSCCSCPCPGPSCYPSSYPFIKVSWRLRNFFRWKAPRLTDEEYVTLNIFAASYVLASIDIVYTLKWMLPFLFRYSSSPSPSPSTSLALSALFSPSSSSSVSTLPSLVSSSSSSSPSIWSLLLGRGGRSGGGGGSRVMFLLRVGVTFFTLGSWFYIFSLHTRFFSQLWNKWRNQNVELVIS